MRTINDHKLNGLNDALEITVLDEPGSGGAYHEYLIDWKAFTPTDVAESVKTQTQISFQNGPIQESGVNGISVEALISVVIDRLARGVEGTSVK